MLGQRRRYQANVSVGLTSSVSGKGTRRWLNAGATLLVRIRNKTLAQHWVNAYNTSFNYIRGWCECYAIVGALATLGLYCSAKPKGSIFK